METEKLTPRKRTKIDFSSVVDDEMEIENENGENEDESETQIDKDKLLLTAGQISEVDFLNDYFVNINDLLGNGPVKNYLEVNNRFYFIWKNFGYATGHHQDIHVSPHCTIYNQMSGYSMFHFLPLLIGLYVGYVGQTFGAQAVTSMLRQIDGTCKAKKNGSYGQKVIAGPGDLVFITGFSNHGVFVPPFAENSQYQRDMFSAVRACELYLTGSRRAFKRAQTGKRWFDFKNFPRAHVPKFEEVLKQEEERLKNEKKKSNVGRR